MSILKILVRNYAMPAVCFRFWVFVCLIQNSDISLCWLSHRDSDFGFEVSDYFWVFSLNMVARLLRIITLQMSCLICVVLQIEVRMNELHIVYEWISNSGSKFYGGLVYISVKVVVFFPFDGWEMRN